MERQREFEIVQHTRMNLLEIFLVEMTSRGPHGHDDLEIGLILEGSLTLFIDQERHDLRPGEKLYEEMLMNEEGLQETANKLIHIGKPIEMDDDWFLEKLHQLDLASRQESDHIREVVSEVVPTYHYDKKLEEAKV